jgi:hypothetical protein|tara:strand:+ start:252 stop:509 length:258 start_codon:yes stop_codon:yes gene_type:complete
MKTTGMKITRKDNHDSLWVKVTNGKSWAKLSITRSRIGITVNDESMNAIGDKMWERFIELKETDLKYGAMLDNIADELSPPPLVD